MKKVVNGQLDLFSLIVKEYIRVPDTVENISSGTVEAVLSDAESYLKRGERITDIAREHLKRCLDNKVLSSVEEELYSMNLNLERRSSEECLSKIRNIAGKYLRAMKKEGDEAAAAISELTGGRVSITFHPERKDVVRRVSRTCVGTDVAIGVHVMDGGREVFTCYSVKDYAFSPSYPQYYLYCGDLVCDVRSIVAYCILYHAVEKVLQDNESELREELVQYAMARCDSSKMRQHMADFLEYVFCEKATGTGVSCLRPKICELLCNTEEDVIPSLEVSVPTDNPISEVVWDVLERYGVAVYGTDTEEKWLMQSFRKEVAKILDTSGKISDEITMEHAACVLKRRAVVSNSMVKENDMHCKLWPYLIAEGSLVPFEETFLHMLTFGRKHIPKRTFLSANTCGYTSNDAWLFECFFVLYAMQHDIAEQYKDYKRSESEYAKSYMDKANIPQKTLKAMETSMLNNYFGFVEYDADVDLTKVQEVEKQFVAVKETYFESIDSSSNAIRFRKLGNHQAVGLYYPGVKCLCVDYRFTDSFIHEYGHLIDYELGSLSLKGGFHAIRERYRLCLMGSMEKDRELNAKMKGKSKYNMSYYLKPTEIFARSFELFCSCVLGIQNDLLPVAFAEAVYPVYDKEYMEEVRQYFCSLFNISNVGEKPTEMEVEDEVA